MKKYRVSPKLNGRRVTASTNSTIPKDIKEEYDRLYDWAVDGGFEGEDIVYEFFNARDGIWDLDYDDRPLVYRVHGTQEVLDYMEDYFRIYHPELYDLYVNM
jgi:hypothetical protein